MFDYHYEILQLRPSIFLALWTSRLRLRGLTDLPWAAKLVVNDRTYLATASACQRQGQNVVPSGYTKVEECLGSLVQDSVIGTALEY